MKTKRSVLMDEKGLPLAAVLSGANTHDVKLQGEALDSLVIPRPRGEEKKELESDPNFHARHRVAEVTHSFFNCFRKLLVCFEKKAANYLTLIYFACAIIVWRKIIPVHS